MASFTGSRSKYVYESDGGGNYSLLLDEELSAIAGTALVAQTNQTGVTPKPQRFKPRGVYWQGDTGQRKFLVCGKADAALYATNSSTTLTIDGVAGKITGRTGERQSF